MPIHDWTRVDAGIYHAFHLTWIAELNRVLNGGLLPSGYYALPEQHAGKSIPDILTLHASPSTPEPLPLPPATGGTAVAEAPPKVQRRQSASPSARALRRTMAIRHVSQHRLVALLEIVSPANKDRPQSVFDFVSKLVEALDHGIHVLLIDILPPALHDAAGMHGAVWQSLQGAEEPYDLPDGEPLTLASYVAANPVDIYLEHPTVGMPVPTMPLFLRPDRYINVPLDAAYQEAYRTMPAFWRDVVEGKK